MTFVRKYTTKEIHFLGNFKSSSHYRLRRPWHVPLSVFLFPISAQTLIELLLCVGDSVAEDGSSAQFVYTARQLTS